MSKNKRNIIITTIVIFSIISLITILLTINKNNVDEVVLKENVIIITDETDADLQPYKVDENNLYFKGNPQYHKNEIIVSGITEIAPNGYIREIVEIKEINGEFVFETQPATFLDVFEKLHFSEIIELTENKNNENSTELMMNTLKISPNLLLKVNTMPVTNAKNSNTENGERKNLFQVEFDEKTDDFIQVKGSAEAKVWLELKIDIENDNIELSLTANDEVNGNIFVGYQTSYDENYEKEIFSKQLPNIQIMAGPVPIVITNDITAKVECEAEISGEIGATLEIKETSKNGFIYSSKDTTVEEINEKEFTSGGVECNTGATAEGSAKAGVGIYLTTLFYDCSGAEMVLGVEGKAEGEITVDANTLNTDDKYYGKLSLSISPNISGNIIVQIPVIDDDLYEMEIFKVELKPFWEKVWENKVNNVLSKDYSDELWWISYKDIIKTIKNSKESVLLGEFIPFPGVVWGSPLEGGPGYGGVASYWNLQNGDEMLYCLKEINQNSVPLLVIASKRNNNIKILSVYQFDTNDYRDKYSYAITSNAQPNNDNNLVLLCSDECIYTKYDWGSEYIYYCDTNGDFVNRNYKEATDKSKLIQPEDMTWISIKKWTEKDLIVETTENKNVLNSTDCNKIYKKIITATEEQNQNSTKIYFPVAVDKKWESPENWASSGTYTTGYPSRTGELVYALKDVTYDEEKIPELFIGVKQNDTIKVLAVYSIDSSTGAGLMIVKKKEDTGEIKYISWSLPTIYSESYFAPYFPSWSYGGGSCCNKDVFARIVEELNLVWISTKEFN